MNHEHRIQDTIIPNAEESRNLLMVFARCPEPGKVKTRLIPAIGEYGAARLQRDMTLHALRTARGLGQDIAVELHMDGGNQEDIHRIFGAETSIRRQAAGDLGERMLHAFRDASGRGFGRMVLMGTDCPLITPEVIRSAFTLLDSHDCVIGPAEDGGYYLIGLKKPCPELFSGISWGTATVFDETLARAHAAGMTTGLLEKLPDIDRPDDIAVWKKVCLEEKPPISVIIPALNEEGSIGETIRLLRQSRGIEIIVADGGSTDRTADTARSLGALVVLTQKGRAVQMNEGALHARGDILFFLHADTRVFQGFDRNIREALTDPTVAAGAFSLTFSQGSIPLKITAWGANLRSRFLGLPYGDQGLFLRREDFHALGGFPGLPILEDAVLVRSLAGTGLIVTLPGKASTSGRRYNRLGVFRTWIINQCTLSCFLMGADPDDLAGLYRGESGIMEWISLLGCTIRKKFKHAGE